MALLGGKMKRSEQIKTYRLHNAIQPDLKDDTDNRPSMTNTETENKCMRIKVNEVCESPKVKRKGYLKTVTLSLSMVLDQILGTYFPTESVSMSAFPVSDAAETSSSQPASAAFHREAHAKYFRSILNVMPSPYASLDTSRMTALYFSVVGLDVLGQLDSVNKQEIIEYIYTLQLANSSKGVSSAGFIGGSFANHLECGICKAEGPTATVTVAESCASCPFPHSIHEDYHQGHIAMTYTALMSLTTLGDDLSRVNRAHTLEGLAQLQMPSGAFRSTLNDSGEADVRFLYCACAISAALDDWSSVDTDAAVRYIQQCVTYEGGIAVVPDGEATGGSCYCAIAALCLMNRLDALSAETLQDLVQWGEARQVNGYQGRTNKDPDSCYSFWVGATLHMLQSFQYTDLPSTQSFLLTQCQGSVHSGGFSKLPDCYPDVLHTFYSICWLSFAEYEGLKSIDPTFAICAEKSALLK